MTGPIREWLREVGLRTPAAADLDPGWLPPLVGPVPTGEAWVVERGLRDPRWRCPLPSCRHRGEQHDVWTVGTTYVVTCVAGCHRTMHETCAQWLDMISAEHRRRADPHGGAHDG